MTLGQPLLTLEAMKMEHALNAPFDGVVDEVAAELGIPVGTLRSRVFYGLKSLRTVMDEMGVEA